ncbi:hypothetical protein [Crateriforma conspicua]|uniref:Uncharacterized protein n=1 Tax=Crateriforma conspicua TaxID=2527996 RepID=A0A5C5Y1W1_9PLAN|nr:hypothetical protein [Crateriforma conspicua]TWT69140.1 hypothetical protein Pan14r_14240 [Crateriforma conspicua]
MLLVCDSVEGDPIIGRSFVLRSSESCDNTPAGFVLITTARVT